MLWTHATINLMAQGLFECVCLYCKAAQAQMTDEGKLKRHLDKISH